MKKIVEIEGMTCGHCVARVEKALRSVPGIESVKVDLKKNQAEISFASVAEGSIETAVEDAGYTVVPVKEAKSGFSLFKVGMIFVTIVVGVSFVSCTETDVVAQYAVTSFDSLTKKLADRVADSPQDSAWQITAPSGERFLIAYDFSRPNPNGDSPDFELDFDLAPFLAAGLDASKLPATDALKYRTENGRFTLRFDWGPNALKPSSDAKSIGTSFKQVIATYRERIGYHEKLDHYGIALGEGNMVEWAKDLNANDKDFVFILNPEPLIKAGLDPNKVPGWIFAKVEIKDASGKPQQVDKLLKPFDL